MKVRGLGSSRVGAKLGVYTEREENVWIDGLVLSCGGLCQRVVYCACYRQASEGPTWWWWVDAQVCLGWWWGLLGSHWDGACRLGRRGATGSLQGWHQQHCVLSGR